MAYVVTHNKFRDVGIAAGNYTITLPSNSVDDHIFIVFTQRFNSAAATATGWTSTGYNAIGGNAYTQVLYKKITTPLTSVTVTLSTTSTVALAGISMTIRGAHGTTPLDVAVGFSTVTSLTPTAPSVTTTTNNALILRSYHNYTGRDNEGLMNGPHIDQCVMDYRSSVTIGYDYQPTAGATAATAWYGIRETAQQIGMLTLAIRDSGAGLLEGYCDLSTPPAEVVRPIGYQGGGGNFGSGTFNPTTLIPSITHGTVTATSSEANYQSLQAGLFGDLTHGATATLYSDWSTARITGLNLKTSQDLSGEILTFKLHYDTQMDVYSQVSRVFAISDGTNSRVWQVEAEDTVPVSSQVKYPVIIEVEGGHEIDDTTGTAPTLTAITDIVYGGVYKNNYQNQAIGWIYKLKTMKIIGGTSTLPASFSSAYKAAKGGITGSVQAQVEQSLTQFFCTQKIQIGNGSTTTYWKSFGQSAEWPAAYDEANLRVQCKVSAATFGLYIYASSSDTVNLSSTTLNFGNYHNFEINALTSSSATYNFSGLGVINATVTLNDIGSAISGITFSGCKEITLNSADLTGGNTISSSADTYAVTVTSQAQFEKLKNCDFKDNNYSIKITGNHTGTWSGAGMTVSGGTGSYDIEYTGTGSLTLTMDVGSGWSQSRTTATGGGTLTVTVPTTDVTITSNISADIKLFDGGTTQTATDSTTGTSLAYTYSGTKTWYYTVMKAGYLPQRGSVTGTDEDLNVSVTLVEDPIYNASHGLTFTTDYSYSAATRILTIVANQQGRDVYSALIDDFISQSTLNNRPFPIVAVGPDRFDFISDGTTGATIDSGDIQFWKGAGMVWEHNTTGNDVARYCSVKSVGTIGGTTYVGYQQTDGGTVNPVTLISGVVDQVIQYYSDTNGDGTPDYNYEGHLLFKVFAVDHYIARNDVIDSYGITALEPYEYTIVLENTATGLASGTQGLTITITDQQATPVEEQTGYTYSYKVTEASAGASPEAILAQWLYDLYTTISGDATALYQSKLAFNWPCPIVESGGSYSSVYQYVEGVETTTEHHGFYFEESASYHPDFLQQQEDEDSGSGFFVTPILAQISITNIPNAGTQRLQIYNSTTLTEIYNGDPAATTYSDSYTNGDAAYASAGDSIRIRFSELNGSTSFKYFSTVVTASTSGFSVNASDFLITDSVYASNAIDGSLITNFTADFTEDQIEIASDTDFTAAQAYAFYCHQLTTATGVDDFWGGVTANDTGNYKINTSVLNLYFDSPLGVTYSVKQTDTARIYRDDDAYPVKDPSTSGYGVQINWKNVVYVQNVGGSSLTAGESASLTNIESKATAIDGLLSNIEGTLDHQEAMRVILAATAGKVSGADGTTITFRDTTDAKDRIVATVDENGNRTAVTLDVS